MLVIINQKWLNDVFWLGVEFFQCGQQKIRPHLDLSGCRIALTPQLIHPYQDSQISINPDIKDRQPITDLLRMGLLVDWSNVNTCGGRP